MAGAMGKVAARLPQGDTGQRIEIDAARAPGKSRRRNGDHALEHQRELAAHLAGRLAHRQGAGDVRCAVLVLGAGIQQEQFALAQQPVGIAVHPVMDDRAVRAGAGDGVEGDVLQRKTVLLRMLGAHRFQLFGGGDLGNRSGLLPVEPGKETRHRDAVAQMRGARPGDLAVILDRPRQPRRVRHLGHRAAGGLDDGRQARRGKLRIETDGAPGGLAPDRRLEGLRRVDVGQCCKMVLHRIVQLGRIDEERRAPVGAQDGEAQHQRRVRHVRAADVEGPGDGGRVGQDRRIGLGIGDRSGQLGELVARRLAGEALRMDDGAAGRRRGTVIPDPVDRIDGQSDEFAAHRFQRGAQAFRLARRVQPGIEADTLAGGFSLQEIGQRGLGRGDRFEDVEIDLLAHLQRIAAVDENRRAARQHHRDAGRAGKAGQPFQPRRRGRDVFALMLVGARHDEAVDAVGAQSVPQAGDPGRALGKVGDLVEALEHRLALEKGGGRTAARGDCLRGRNICIWQGCAKVTGL